MYSMVNKYADNGIWTFEFYVRPDNWQQLAHHRFGYPRHQYITGALQKIDAESTLVFSTNDPMDAFGCLASSPMPLLVYINGRLSPISKRHKQLETLQSVFQGWKRWCEIVNSKSDTARRAAILTLYGRVAGTGATPLLYRNRRAMRRLVSENRRLTARLEARTEIQGALLRRQESQLDHAFLYIGALIEGQAKHIAEQHRDTIDGVLYFVIDGAKPEEGTKFYAHARDAFGRHHPIHVNTYVGRWAAEAELTLEFYHFPSEARSLGEFWARSGVLFELVTPPSAGKTTDYGIALQEMLAGNYEERDRLQL